MKKRALSLLLAVLMLVTVLPVMASAANMAFTDVPANAWYYDDVKSACESQLINGKTATTFAPEDNLTYAEAVKLAAAMNQKYLTGSVTLTNGNPWYQTYVDYCKSQRIISKDYDWNKPATRAEYIDIFARALPTSALGAINTIADNAIPDVPMSHPQAASIYRLYRAGVIEGSTDYLNGVKTDHLCKPSDNIRRCEVAAILTRMMSNTARKTFTVGETYENLRITKQPENVTAAVGATATFNVTVYGGKMPYTYDWQARRTNEANWGSLTANVNGKSYLNYLVQSFLFTGVGYEFRCVITDAAGMSVASNAVKIVPNSTVLTAKLSNTSITQASSTNEVALSVTAGGGVAPYTYQWYWSDVTGDWHNLSGSWTGVSNTSSISFTPGSVGTRWYMLCRVTDATGTTVDSDICTITVTNAYGLVANISQTAVSARPGSSIQLTATIASGKAPYTYQWYVRTGTSGSWSLKYSASSYYAASDYTVTHGTANSASTLVTQAYCHITDASGFGVDTPVCTITSGTLLTSITPSSAKIAYGNSVTLESSVAGGTAPYTYQWLYSIDGTKWYVAQGTSSKFTFSPYNAPSVQYVMLTVYDKYGSSANSNVCTITVTGSSTGVSVSIPAGYTVVAGQTLDLTALASGGSGTYKYQWQYSTDGTNWTNLGSGLATYTYRTVASPNKQYLRVVVTDSTGKEATSNVCTINVTPGSLTDTLRVVSQPATPTLSLGDSFTLTVTVDGTAPYTYQWQRAYGNGTWSNVGSRQTTASVTSSISGTVSATDAAYGVYYKCVISDATGAAVETVPVSLNIKNTTPSTDALSIAFSQTNYEITEGASLTLQPIVTGNPITFSWYIDGSSYASSYANTYVIGNMKAGTQHEVTCEVKDAKGNVAKATCYVYVSADMYVDLFPASNVKAGQAETFQIQTIYGTTGQLTISWYLDGNLVATNAGRTWTHTFGPNDVGNHTVTVVVKDESARAAATDSTTFTVQRASGSNAGK